MKDKDIIVVDIYLTRGVLALLALVLLIVAGLGGLAWGRSEASASGSSAPLAQSAGMRQYYLTRAFYDGDEADGANVCAAGYHFASFWEIVDPSNLKYNTALGDDRPDSGRGPSSVGIGWVRTGYNNSTSNTAGKGNCLTWYSSDVAHYGTVAKLTDDWEAAKDIHIFKVGAYTCDNNFKVWCVED